jgi:hypothetical protein
LNSVAVSQTGMTPEFIDKLRNLSRRLRPGIPSELSGVIEAVERSPHNNPSITRAGAQGGIEENRGGTLVDSPASQDQFRDQIDRARHLSTIKAMIGRRNLAEALGATLSIDQGMQKLLLLSEIGLALRLEKELHFSTYVTDLVIRTANDLPHTPRKADILLNLLQAGPSWKIVDTAIETLNGLNGDTDRLLTGNSFRMAFMNTIKLDKDGAFDKIKEIRSVSFELMARLALCEALLNQQNGK